MGYVKILTDQYPQAILRHIWETSKNAEFFFLKSRDNSNSFGTNATCDGSLFQKLWLFKDLE